MPPSSPESGFYEGVFRRRFRLRTRLLPPWFLLAFMLLDLMVLAGMFLFGERYFAGIPSIELRMPLLHAVPNASDDTEQGLVHAPINTPVVSVTHEDLLFYEDEIVTSDALIRRLRETRTDESGRELLIQADREVRYQVLMELVQSARRAGIEQVYLVTLPVIGEEVLSEPTP